MRIEREPRTPARAPAEPSRREVLATALRLGWLGLGAGLGTGGLGGCGGGGVGSNGTGSPVLAAQSVGTVSGFGSVVVDGVRHDDSAAAVERERADGGSDGTEMALGQRVALDYAAAAGGTLQLERIEVRPTLVGRVSERTDETLGVLGQTVVVNADPALGPVTVLGGSWTGADQIAIGQAVEVHAIVLGVPASAGGAGLRLLATRIEPLATLEALRLNLPVTAVGTAGTDGRLPVRIGSLAVSLPAGASATLGVATTVFAEAGAFDATRLSLQALRAESDPVELSAQAGVRLERVGLIAGWSGSALTLDGVSMTVDATTERVPATLSPADGLYARVTALRGTDARWHASRIEAVASRSAALLVGNVTDWSVTSRSFRVRDTRVQMDAQTTIDLASCSGTASLANGLYVEVAGTVGSRGVLAATVRCLPEPRGTSARLTRHGRVTALDAVARTLQLLHRPGDAALTVIWDERTHWRTPLSAQALAALVGTTQRIEVEGLLSADGLRLQAQQVRLRETVADSGVGSGSTGVRTAADQSRSSSDTLQRCQSAS